MDVRLAYSTRLNRSRIGSNDFSRLRRIATEVATTCHFRDGLILLLAIGLAACAPQSGEPQPPDIAYGQDVCDECGMIIDEPRFAAASLTTDSMMSKFDDIGDMLAFHAGRPDVQVHAWFVHDYNTEEWMRGETAFYVRSAQIVSPMGHGIAAFRDRSAAETFAGGIGASVLTFDALRAAR